MSNKFLSGYFLKLCFLPVLFFLISCANVVAPTGGPKDEQPPKVMECIPANFSPGFQGDEIKITFDEFIKLNNINSQVIISPPPEKIPDFTLRKKILVIKFKEELKPTTTYTIFFGKSIADITESNALSGFQYVFSTGSYVDSLTISGSIADGFTNSPKEDIFIMLYNKIYDSVPYKEKPLYITRSDKNGDFKFTSLGNDRYKIFALKDANNNYLYDLPNESAAFLDSLIILEPADTSRKDSIRKRQYKLYLFEEKDTTQKLLKSETQKNEKVTFIFRSPVKNLMIKPLNKTFDYNWYIKEQSATKDTISYWLKDIKTDSLTLELSDGNTFADTAEFDLSKTSQKAKKGKQDDKLVLSLNASNDKPFDFFRTVCITFSSPVSEYDFSKIIITEITDTIKKDTITPAITFADSVYRKLNISHNWKENQNYSIFIPPSCFKDIFNRTNDTISINFKTKELKQYGSLKLNITLPEENADYIIQLMDEKEKIFQEDFISKNESIIYKHLNPAKYKVKIIYDANGNSRWDTGKYLKKRQPECVKYYPELINIRSNWDIDIDWNLKTVKNL